MIKGLNFVGNLTLDGQYDKLSRFVDWYIFDRHCHRSVHLACHLVVHSHSLQRRQFPAEPSIRQSMVTDKLQKLKLKQKLLPKFSR